MGTRNLLIAAIAFFISNFLFFSGCSDNSLQSVSSMDLSGKVYGTFSVPQPNILVKANDKSSITGPDGTFFLSQVTAPYNITVRDSVNKSVFEIIYIFFQQFYPNKLAIPTNLLPSNINPAHININYPNGLFQQAGKLIFTDNNDINAYEWAGINGGIINLQMASGQSIKGSVIVLLFSQQNGNIISYDKYAYKDNIIVTSGSTLDINFSANDFNSNIKDTTYNIVLNPLPNHTVTSRILYLSFSSRRTSDFVNVIKFEEFTSNNFNVVVPVNLEKYCVPVIGLFTQNTAADERCKDLFPVYGNITHNSIEASQLINPPDNSMVDSNTVISFSGNSVIPNHEFYIIYLSDTLEHSSFNIVTDKTSYKLSELNTLGLGNISGKTFIWYVERFGTPLFDYIGSGFSNLEITSTTSAYKRFTVK